MIAGSLPDKIKVYNALVTAESLKLTMARIVFLVCVWMVVELYLGERLCIVFECNASVQES